ncbi:DUF4135 domain-containing protein [Enterococcus rivorum]|uniref:DUF4135 domain-containing protein n=1 Tax=Enterococcus rivorum TaxID=762845 RepID=UPI00362B85D0
MPFIPGKETDVIKYIELFSAGFRETMEALTSKKESLKIWLNSKRFENTSYRQVLRPTYVYGKILDTGIYPTYLIDSIQRKKLFERVICQEDREGNQRERDEVAVLLEGNVPAYECYYNSTDLYRGDVAIQKNYFFQNHQKK